MTKGHELNASVPRAANGGARPAAPMVPAGRANSIGKGDGGGCCGILIIAGIVGLFVAAYNMPEMKEIRARREGRESRTPTLEGEWTKYPAEVQQFHRLASAGLGQWSGPTRGRMLVIDYDEGTVDFEILSDLPAELAASRPDQVGTVAFTQWGSEVVGRYRGSGAAASVVTCEVVVVDCASRGVVARKSFRGGKPPKRVGAGAGPQIGYRPTDDVGDFLKSLPRVTPAPSTAPDETAKSPQGATDKSRVKELWNEGAAKLHAGDKAGAIKSFEAALELDPHNQGIKDKLKQLKGQ